MITVPLQPVASQTFNILLSGQSVTLNVYQKPYGLFMDVLVNNRPIVQGVLAQNANRIVRDAYLGFIGDFAFYDTYATPFSQPTDPVFTGLGVRYQLVYFTPSDLATFGLAA